MDLALRVARASELGGCEDAVTMTAVDSTTATAVRPPRLEVGRRGRIAAGLLAACLGAACVARFGATGEALVGVILIVVLVWLSVVDLETRLLPNRIVLPTTAVVLVLQLAFYPERAVEWLVASLGAALFIFLPLLVYPAGMGMGDVKLALLMGAALGSAVVVALLVAMVAAFVVALAILVRGGLAARKTSIPYGPFLAFGAIVALLL
jgi:leader peptidase (prepilin peptidase) / N-methyltransferase